MAGLAVQALTAGGFAAALVAFSATAAVLVGLLFTAALLVASAQQRLVERLQAGAPAVKRWGGWVLVAVGAWFITLGVWAEQFARLVPV